MILPDLVALAFLLSVPAVSMAQSACALHGSDQTKTVEIRDPHFGERAYTLTIPADWKFEGTVLRAADGSRPELVYRATSPDGFMAVQRMPRYDWEWSDNTTYQKFLADSNLRPMKPMTAAEFVKRIVVPKARNGAQVGAAEPIPEVSKQVAEQDKEVNAKFAAMARQTGIPPSRVITSAERVRIRYQLGEKAEEEWIRTITSSLELPGRSISFAWVATERALKGQLDACDKRLTGMIRSVTVDQGWNRKEQAFASQQHERQMANIQQQIRGMNANQKATFEASMAAARTLSAIGHQSATATAEHMGDLQSMIDPATGRTGQVSNQYNYSWADQDGAVVQGNSPGLNPNVHLRGNWTQLQPVKPQ